MLKARKIVVLGPNGMGANDPFTFHVHAASCADLKQPKYRRVDGADWPVLASSQQAVVESVYSDHMGEQERELAFMLEPGSMHRAWGDQPERPFTAEEIESARVWSTWEPYAPDFRFFPCTDLPITDTDDPSDNLKGISTMATTKTPAPPKAEKAPKAKVPCGCGCGAQVDRAYLPGHDAKHKSALIAEAIGGNKAAEKTLETKGWTKFLDTKKAVLAKKTESSTASKAEKAAKTKANADARAEKTRKLAAARLVLKDLDLYGNSAKAGQVALESDVAFLDSIIDGTHPRVAARKAEVEAEKANA